MAVAPRIGIADFYERDVLPALTRRLDTAFPEFAWVRDAQGWRASNQAFTHATFGVRADRVVCHGDAPRGFLIHGHGATLWTTYLNDGHAARGRDFVTTVRALADRAGLDTSHLERPPSNAERTANLLHDAFVFCRRELASERGAAALAYLEQRGIPRHATAETTLGLMPSTDRLRLALVSDGYSEREIITSSLLSDSRWPGRIVGAWRDEHSRVRTLWARTITNDDARYLYLRGAARSATIPYGLSSLLRHGQRPNTEELLLVEGVLDVHILRAHGHERVAALGGTATTPHLFEQLATLGIKHVTFALDNDPAGYTATARAIEASTRAADSPHVWVIDPDLLDDANDPAELIRKHGPERWRAASAAPVCGISWRALDLTSHPSLASEPDRQRAFDHASAWLATLPPRTALEQTRALHTLADSLGYDPEATLRAFRARHWRREPDRTPPAHGIER